MEEKNAGSLHAGHRARLKAKYLKGGLDDFNDLTTLELLLFYAVGRRDVSPLALSLLDHFGSLTEVLEAPPEKLMAVEGVGEHTAILISLASRLSRRLMGKRLLGYRPLTCAEDAGALLLPSFVGRQHEELAFVLFLDRQCLPSGVEQISQGTNNTATVDVRKIIGMAADLNAHAVVLAHNHPSGIALPSDADIAATSQLYHTLRDAGIFLIDHLVIAKGDYVSMMESCMLPYTGNGFKHYRTFNSRKISKTSLH